MRNFGLRPRRGLTSLARFSVPPSFRALGHCPTLEESGTGKTDHARTRPKSPAKVIPYLFYVEMYLVNTSGRSSDVSPLSPHPIRRNRASCTLRSTSFIQQSMAARLKRSACLTGLRQPSAAAPRPQICESPARTTSDISLRPSSKAKAGAASGTGGQASQLEQPALLPGAKKAPGVRAIQ